MRVGFRFGNAPLHKTARQFHHKGRGQANRQRLAAAIPPTYRRLAGSTSERVGFAKYVTAGGINAILTNAQAIAPGISNLPIVATWAGLRPRAAEGLPVLGPCGEIDGLFYATGHYRNGILLAPLTGELISEAIVSSLK